MAITKTLLTVVYSVELHEHYVTVTSLKLLTIELTAANVLVIAGA